MKPAAKKGLSSRKAPDKAADDKKASGGGGGLLRAPSVYTTGSGKTPNTSFAATGKNKTAGLSSSAQLSATASNASSRSASEERGGPKPQQGSNAAAASSMLLGASGAGAGGGSNSAAAASSSRRLSNVSIELPPDPVRDFALPIFTTEPASADMLGSLVLQTRLAQSRRKSKSMASQHRSGSISMIDPITGFSIRDDGQLDDIAGNLADGDDVDDDDDPEAKNSKAEMWLPGHRDTIRHIAVDQEMGVVVTASWDETAMVWDLTKGTVAGVLVHGAWVNAVVIAGGAPTKLIVTASEDGFVNFWIRQWNRTSSQEDGAGGMDANARAASMSLLPTPSGGVAKSIAEGSVKSALKADATSSIAAKPPKATVVGGTTEAATDHNSSDSVGEGSGAATYLLQHQVVVAHGAAITALAVLQDQMVFAAALDVVVAIHLTTGSIIREYRSARSADVTCLAVSEDCLFTGHDDGKIQAWDLLGAFVLRELKGHGSAACRCLLLSSHNVLYSGGDDGRVLAWAVNTGALVRKFLGHTKSVRSLAIHIGDRERFIYSSGHDGTVRCSRLTGDRSKVVRSCLCEAIAVSQPLDEERWMASRLLCGDVFGQLHVFGVVRSERLVAGVQHA